jgi:hypothetical protein
LAVIQVRLKHIQLIQIGQQGACRWVHVANPGFEKMHYRIAGLPIT